MTPKTVEMLENLPKFCKNYKDEFVGKGKSTSTIFKLKLPPKKQGDYFNKLGFDFRNQVWYEGDPIDS